LNQLRGSPDGKAAIRISTGRFLMRRRSELLRILAEDIAKVNYPGLDLSHLYTK
jgi:hypothetical protein